MRPLFDENLSPTLVTRTADFTTSQHVREVGLRGGEDLAVWRWAQSAGFAIVSKDVDFADLAVRLGPPPKVIHLRLGNCTTPEVEAVLRAHIVEIKLFLTTNDVAVLSIERSPP